MTDKIIEAARSAGGTTYTNRHHNGTACAFGPEALARFYAIARAEALEDAAKVCESIANEYERTEGRKYPEMKSDAQTGASDCEYAIRALKEQDAAIARATHKEQT
jgi:hypothetical protein